MAALGRLHSSAEDIVKNNSEAVDPENAVVEVQFVTNQVPVAKRISAQLGELS